MVVHSCKNIILDTTQQLILVIMSKGKSEQYKEKYTILCNFIESFSKREAQKCKKNAQKMDQTSRNHAKLCIQYLSMQTNYQQQSKKDSKAIQKLQQKYNNLSIAYQKQDRIKGLKLTNEKLELNNLLSIIDLISKGFYLQAKSVKTSRPYQFIDHLIEYSSLKSIYNSFEKDRKVQKILDSRNRQYCQLANILINQNSIYQKISKEALTYAKRIDAVSEQQEWPQPKHIRKDLFDTLRSVEWHMRVLKQENMKYRQLIFQSPSELQYSEHFLSRSANSKSSQLFLREIEYRIRQIHRSIDKNNRQILINDTAMSSLDKIQIYIKQIEKINQRLQRDMRIGEQEIQDKITIMSLEARISHLEKIKDNMLERLVSSFQTIKTFYKPILKSSQIDEKDQDQVIRVIEQSLNFAANEIQQRQRQLQDVVKDRNKYMNQFNRMKIIENNSDDFQRNEQLMFRRSSEEYSYEDLAQKVKNLEVEKEQLITECNNCKDIITLKQEKIDQLTEKYNKLEQERRSIKIQIDTEQRQKKKLKSHLHSQTKKIKQLESSINISSPQKLELKSQSSNKEIQLKKESSLDFLSTIRKIQNQDNNKIILFDTINNELQQQKQLNQKLTQENAQLNSKLSILQNINNTLQNDLRDSEKKITQLNKKILFQKDTNESQACQLNQLNQFIQDLQNEVKVLETQIQNLKSASIEKSIPIVKQEVSTKAQKEPCSKCQELSNENTQYKNKITSYELQNTKLRNRIKDLEKSNLFYMEEGLKISKEKREALTKMESQLIQLKKSRNLTHFEQQNSQIKDQLSALEKAYSHLKSQNDQLKQTIAKGNSAAIYALKNTVQSNRPHLFTAKGIFQEDQQQYRQLLIKVIQRQVGIIYQTKLLYSFDPLNKVNFHHYIDNHKNLVLIIKTMKERLIAAYSQSEISINGTHPGLGLLISLWNDSVYYLYEGKKPVTYDDYFIIFGNSQIRIKSQDDKVFSNFGITNGFFNNEKKKVEHLLGQPQRQTQILTYEIYEVILQEDRY